MDETYANAVHGMLKTGMPGTFMGQLDRVMAVTRSEQQESFSKTPGTRGSPDRSRHPTGGKVSHPLHFSTGSGSQSKTARSSAQTARLPAKTVSKSWPTTGNLVYNSRTVPGEGDALDDERDGLHLTSAWPKATKGPGFVHRLGIATCEVVFLVLCSL